MLLHAGIYQRLALVFLRDIGSDDIHFATFGLDLLLGVLRAFKIQVATKYLATVLSKYMCSGGAISPHSIYKSVNTLQVRDNHFDILGVPLLTNASDEDDFAL